MSGKRANNEGSIYRRRDGRWAHARGSDVAPAHRSEGDEGGHPGPRRALRGLQRWTTNARRPMARGLAAATSLALLGLVALSAACDGGDDGGGPAIDIRDFDTARFTMTQTSTSGEESSQFTGEGLIDNRKQALSVTYEGGPGGQITAIGRTVYTLSEGESQWTSVEETTDGQVGFGRPYWPKFWLDAVQVEGLGGRSLQGGETTGYRLSFDLEKVAKRLSSSEASEPLDVRQAEVEVSRTKALSVLLETVRVRAGTLSSSLGQEGRSQPPLAKP